MFLNKPFAKIDLAPDLEPLNNSYPTTLVIYVPSLFFGLPILVNSTPRILIKSPFVVLICNGEFGPPISSEATYDV
jgi:hypothetical protein